MAEADDGEKGTAQRLFSTDIVNTPHEVRVGQEPPPEVILTSKYLDFSCKPPEYDVNNVCVELNLVLEVVSNL